MVALAVADSTSRADAVYAELRAEIMVGSLAPGAAIDAGDLAARFGVSKTPVRDALRRLAQEELVEIFPRSGYRVRPITFQAVHELFDLRAALGPHAARAAALHITAPEIAALRAILRDDYKAGQGTERLQSAARRFHVAVARASRNERLAALTDGLFEQLERLLRLTVDLSLRVPEHAGDHGRLVDALEARDGAAAAAIEAAHIAKSRAFLLETLLVQGHFASAEIRPAPQLTEVRS